MYTWGDDSQFNHGAQGDGTSGNIYHFPVQVGALTDWSVISGTRIGAIGAIKTGGTLWTWGANTNGALGLGDTTNRSSPVQVGALTTWSKISCNNHMLAIKTDGTLWAWGLNNKGQLGLGDVTARSSPVQVGALTDWAQVAAGSDFSLAVKTDGTLWSWGEGGQGQLASSGIADRSSPVQVGILTNWQYLAELPGSGTSALAVKTNGTLWAWGSNSSGQLGTSDTTNYSSPVQVGALTTWGPIVSIDLTSVALKTDGTIWAWGSNTNGSIGDGTTTNKSSPVQIGADVDWTYISTGSATTIGLK
jgi:alpha-tubulin suppressor-like RCC1 family protein